MNNHNRILRGQDAAWYFRPVAWLLIICFCLIGVRNRVQAIAPSTTPELNPYVSYVAIIDAKSNDRSTSLSLTGPVSMATITDTVTPTLVTTLSFAPYADTRVQDNTPTTNYGLSPELRVRANDPTYYTYLKFNVVGVNGSVQSARLRLYVSKESQAGGAIYLVGNTYLNSDVAWIENGLTWENAPEIPSTPLSTLGTVAVNNWVEFDVTGAVQGEGIFSFAITSTSQSEVNYNSKEADANQPVLVIEFASGLEPTPTMTPPPISTDDPVLVGAGDIASCNSEGDEITANLLDQIPGTVFTTGDNAYPDGTIENFANCYNPTWGRHRERTRPAPGNHDYHTAGATAYFDYFGANAGDPAKGYYSYDLGAWHIVVINSNCAEVGGCKVGSPQEQWLRADLAAHPALCTLAYWHHPRFSSGALHGGTKSVEAIWRALYDAGADVVLNGHEHNYERFALQTPSGEADPTRGIRQFIVGTGGASLYAPGPPLANSEVINSDTHGVLKLALHPTSYDWEFIAEPGKPFTDAGSGFCTPMPSSQGTVQEIRTLYPSEWDVPRPAGLAYSTDFNELFLLDKNNSAPSGQEGAQIVVITPYEQFVGAVTPDFIVDNAINMAVDDHSAHLYLLNGAQAQLARIKLGANGLPDLTTLERFDIGRLGLGSPQGMAVDATNDQLFILDSATSHVISMTLNADIGSPEVQFSTIDLSTLGVPDLRGIAVHPLNHYLYVTSPTTQQLYELTTSGQLITTYDLRPLALTDPRGFVFAPSADTTDSPTTIHLFLADSNLADNQPIHDGSIQRAVNHHIYLPIVMQPPLVTSASASTSKATQVAGNTQLLGEILELALLSEICHIPCQSFSTRVVSSVDDAEEYSPNEPVRVESTDLELIQDGGSQQTVGIRFTNVTIPPGATILTATIAFETDEVYTVPTSLAFAGEASASPAPFAATVKNISSRRLTAARVDWPDIPVWAVAAEEHQTPNLAPIVQEIINRTEWNSGNALAFIITGEGKRVAKAFDGSPVSAPRLDIVYVVIQ